MNSRITKITLGDFQPKSVWYVSRGAPMGAAIELFWNGDDTESGEIEPMDGIDAASHLPFSSLDSADESLESNWFGLTGTVNGDGTWEWDGEGNPKDFNLNTVTALTAEPWPTD